MPPQVGVGVAVYIFDYDEDLILLVKRQGSHGADTWAPPGGWVEKGESLIQAAIREVKEEVGLVFEDGQEFGYTENHFAEGIHDVCFTVVAQQWDGEPTICEPEKIADIGWFPVEHLHKENLFLPMRQRVDDGSLLSTYKIFKENPF